MGVNRLPKTVTRQRHDCDLNPGPSAPESSTLTTRLPSHPTKTNNEHNMSKWYDDTGEQLFGNEKVLTKRPAVAVHGRQHSLQPSHYTPQTHSSIKTVTRGKYWPTDEYVSSVMVPVCTALKPTVSRLTTTEFYDKLVTKSSKSFGWGRGGTVTNVGWQVTLCDPIWYVSSRSGVACCWQLYPATALYLTAGMPACMHACTHKWTDRSKTWCHQPTATT